MEMSFKFASILMYKLLLKLVLIFCIVFYSNVSFCSEKEFTELFGKQITIIDKIAVCHTIVHRLSTIYEVNFMESNSRDVDKEVRNLYEMKKRSIFVDKVLQKFDLYNLASNGFSASVDIKIENMGSDKDVEKVLSLCYVEVNSAILSLEFKDLSDQASFESKLAIHDLVNGLRPRR